MCQPDAALLFDNTWGHVRRDQLSDAQEGVLEDQTRNVPVLLVLGNQIDGHRAAQALPVDDDLGVSRLDALADVVEPRLGIDVEARLVRRPRRQPVPAVLQHQHVAAQHLLEDLRDGDAVADVARVAVEHQHGDVPGAALVGGPDEEGIEGLAVGRRDLEVLVVLDAELARLGDVGTCVGGDVARVDEITVDAYQFPSGAGLRGRLGTYFCLKYRRPLATTARLEDAIIGSLRNCTAPLASVVMFHDGGGGGGDSDMAHGCDRSVSLCAVPDRARSCTCRPRQSTGWRGHNRSQMEAQ